MARLIDADAITKETIVKFVGENGGFISHQDMLSLINAQPTAYDVEKVNRLIDFTSRKCVERLGQAKAEPVIRCMNLAKDYVKKGGVC